METKKSTSVQKRSPIFIGGSLQDHIFFMVSICRLEHTALSLILIHYATWSVVHVSLSIILQTLLGQIYTAEILTVLIAWALFLDLKVGAFYGTLLAIYSIAAHFLLTNSLAATSTVTLVIASLACLFLAIGFEATCHVLIQGPLPGPPSEKLIKLPPWQGPLIGLYFVILFGLFWMSFDLALRYAGYKPDLNKDVNAALRIWHQIEADEAAKSNKTAARDYHLWALKTCQ
jgi:hypothetical protein